MKAVAVTVIINSMRSSSEAVQEAFEPTVVIAELFEHFQPKNHLFLLKTHFFLKNLLQILPHEVHSSQALS